MKKLIKVLFGLAILLPLTQAYAGGGGYSEKTCKGQTTCPSGQTGTISFSYIYRSQFNCSVLDGDIKAMINNGTSDADIRYWGYKKYENSNIVVQRNCVNSAVYKSTETESRKDSCPATHPDGFINMQQTYELWSDGSKRNLSGFKEVSRTCAAIFSKTLTESRSNSCPAGQTGTITQTRTYDVWTDGSIKNYSSWKVSGNTCAANPITLNPGNRVEMCPEGYTGKITYKWEEYLTNDTYSVTDPDGTVVEYIVSTPHQREVVESNTCKLIPSNDNITTIPGNIVLSCDEYYSAAKGTYEGEVIKYGNYVTSYSSATKKSKTEFIVTSIDASSCYMSSSKDMMFDKRVKACDVGQTGEKMEILYYYIDSKGNKTYPYGNEYSLFSNTCTAMQDGNAPPPPAEDNPSGLLFNSNVTTSSLKNNTELKNFIDKLDKSTITNGDYRLNLIIDDLNPKNYNIENVSNTVAAFQKSTPSTTVKVMVPKGINQYSGVNGISSTKDKIVLSSSVQPDGTLKVQYRDVVKGNKTSEIKSFKVKIFNSNVNMNGIISQ